MTFSYRLSFVKSNIELSSRAESATEEPQQRNPKPFGKALPRTTPTICYTPSLFIEEIQVNLLQMNCFSRRYANVLVYHESHQGGTVYEHYLTIDPFNV